MGKLHNHVFHLCIILIGHFTYSTHYVGGSVARHCIVGKAYAFHIHVLIFKFVAMIGATVPNHRYTGNFPDYFISAKTN